MNRSVISRAALVVVAAIGLAACAPAPTPPPGSGGSPGPYIDPVVADPATTPDATFPNVVWPPAGTPRNRLAVVLHGTGSNPQGHVELAAALRTDGYHVVVLRYSAQVATLGACPDTSLATYPNCHRDFRSETVFGSNVADPESNAYDHPGSNVSKPNSVMNRLLKLVNHMATVAPTAGWDQFLQRSGSSCTSFNSTYNTCNLDWGDVSLLGHSQGGGVALYMARFFGFHRVGLMSAAYDAWDLGGGNYSPAAWLSGSFAVPANRIAGLTHSADYGLGRIRAVQDHLGVPGPEVAPAPPPFSSNRILTSISSSCPWDSTPGHNSTAVDACSPDYVYWDAWRFLAGS